MAGGVKVPGGVLVGRRVAAADMPADEAHAQMDPPIPRFQTILAALSAGCYFLNLVQMLALHNSCSFLVLNY